MHKDWLSKPRRIAGVMTGTSVDAVDVAFAEFELSSEGITMRDISGYSSAFSREEREGLLSIIRSPQPISVINDYHVWLSHRISLVVRAACEDLGIEPRTLDAVGMHGQTVWHNPHEHIVHGIPLRSTFQLGSVSTLAITLGIPVVGDFRSADVALGGQGAPLVPRFDTDFLKHTNRNVVALNIGGMANITLLPAGCADAHVRAFDTGPGNVWIDHAMERFFAKRFDHDGEVARRGCLHQGLFEQLKSISYVLAPPPKSTGRELFSGQSIDATIAMWGDEIASDDVVHTLTAFTAWSIAENIRRYGWADSRVVVSGGGLRNKFLMELLHREIPWAEIVTSDDAGIPSSWKECLCFAYLAFRTLGGLPSNMPSVTGASQSAILGVVGYPAG